jgi:hypothetical protein
MESDSVMPFETRRVASFCNSGRRVMSEDPVGDYKMVNALIRRVIMERSLA